jgi:pyruvate/2-oxoglutarate dehydrogenase complex dihydrolipoamide acyltransferase (E2) component
MIRFNKYCSFVQIAKVSEPLESLGDSITTAVLLSWSKKPGDPVKEDDVIGVVETDKVKMNNPST